MKPRECEVPNCDREPARALPVCALHLADILDWMRALGAAARATS